jgi:hypothetical protein
LLCVVTTSAEQAPAAGTHKICDRVASAPDPCQHGRVQIAGKALVAVLVVVALRAWQERRRAPKPRPAWPIADPEVPEVVDPFE